VAKNYYAKRQLVPFGEFVPFRPLLGWLKKFVPIGEGDASRGQTSSPLFVPIRGQLAVFAPLICYEDIFPDLARLSTIAGANVLVVITNNGWFGEGGAAYQHAAHSVLRAVETRRPVLRCGNAGWSGWIDEFGNVRNVMTNSSGTIYFRGTKTIDVSRDARWVDKNSFYVEHGDWFVLVCATLVTFAFVLLKMTEMSAVKKPV
jgi:apolipoprotein N-acyltransferase